MGPDLCGVSEEMSTWAETKALIAMLEDDPEEAERYIEELTPAGIRDLRDAARGLVNSCLSVLESMREDGRS